jgi:hypothetical protein
MIGTFPVRTMLPYFMPYNLLDEGNFDSKEIIKQRKRNQRAKNRNRKSKK